jgi:heme exporter protein D
MMSLTLTIEIMAVNLPEISDLLYVSCYCIGAINQKLLTTQVVLFFFYIIIGTMFRKLLKSLGLYLDRHFSQSIAQSRINSHTTVSMFFIGEVLGLMFYYTFYRVLFESIHSVAEFMLFQVLHLGSEWMLYVLRSSGWYHRHSTTWSAYWRNMCNQGLQKIQCMLCGGCCGHSPMKAQHRRTPSRKWTHRTWQEFVALDFGIRCAIFVATAYGMALLLLTVNMFPYIRRHNYLRETGKDLNQTLLFIAVALVMELINAAIINRFYFKPHGFDVLEMTRHCFALKYFALFTLLIGACLFINPIFAFTEVTFVQ